MSNNLPQYYSGAVIKYLSNVEVNPSSSNQHELNGISQLRDLFGDTERTFNTLFIYLDDDEGQSVSFNSSMKWYDSRESHATRTEYRLYYKSNPVMDRASSGDLIFLGLRPDGNLVATVTKQGSNAKKQIEILFGKQGNRIDLR